MHDFALFIAPLGNVNNKGISHFEILIQLHSIYCHDSRVHDNLDIT